MEVLPFQPFRVEWLDLPDDQLGARLLTEWACYRLMKNGVLPQPVTPELLQKIRDETLAVDDDDPRFLGLGKALHLVCGGEAARGGKLFREYMIGEARRQVDRKFAAEGIKHQKQVRRWSGRGADARRKYSDTDKARWRQMAASLPPMSMGSAAEHIRKKEELPKSALRTIRRVISKG